MKNFWYVEIIHFDTMCQQEMLDFRVYYKHFEPSGSITYDLMSR